MENFLVLGSSLARQVVQNSELCGKNIENILFKGKFDLCSIEKIMKLKNKTYITIFCLAGNDLLPTKLHKQNNKFHVCLDSFCLNECMLVYSSLIDILSKYTKQVIFVEPPPRATYVITNSNCLFYDGNTAQRFRRVINSIKTTINIGVFSNQSLLGYLSTTNSQICAKDKIHFSKEAIAIIQKQVIEKICYNEIVRLHANPN